MKKIRISAWDEFGDWWRVTIEVPSAASRAITPCPHHMAMGSWTCKPTQGTTRFHVGGDP